MTDKEKIRAEIERLLNEVYSGGIAGGVNVKRYLKKVDSFIDSLPKESESEDLEKAAINYMKTENPPIWGLHDGFIAGANWQKQQMMKDAYDAYVSYIRDNSEAVVFLNNTSITMPSHFPKRDLDEGDKLKVIAIKED